MLMPSIFGESLLDDFWGFPFHSYDRTSFGNGGYMNTDIKDTDTGYEITMSLPGVKKEDVKAQLKDGYLTIQASANNKKDEKDDKGRYIRRERYSGSCSRSFYVGDNVTQEDIQGEFKHGVLKLRIPKKEAAPQVEENKYITIE